MGVLEPNHFYSRGLLLLVLFSTMLTSCAATHPSALRPIEGPVGLGEVAAINGLKVRPDQVIEDNRCPPDAQCVVPGRLVVRATVFGGGWSKPLDFTLGIPMQVADGQLTLAAATPAPNARFTFSFQGGR